MAGQRDLSEEIEINPLNLPQNMFVADGSGSRYQIPTNL